MIADEVRIGAEYSECCFCARPALGPGIAVPYRPRFEFARGARELARTLGLEGFTLNKYKSASAVLPAPCAHRARQGVRITWKLIYGGNEND
jgi:hypothetical protein